MMKKWWMKKPASEEASSRKKQEKKTPEPIKQTAKGRWGLKSCTTAHHQQAMIFVFFQHPPGGDYSHSLFAIDIPDLDGGVNPPGPSRMVATTRITTVATITGEYTEREVEVEVEGGGDTRQIINPVLRFEATTWPSYMASALVDKEMFFLGGSTDGEYQREVHVLDMSAISNPFQLTFSQLTAGPPLNSGKVFPEVQVVGTRILVLSGYKRHPYPHAGPGRHRRERLCQLEILDVARGGNWEVGAQPPFDNHRIECHTLMEESWVILARGGTNWGLYSYHFEQDWWEVLDAGRWVGSDGTFPISSGSITRGNHIFSVKTMDYNAIPVLVKRLRVDVGDIDDVEERSYDVIRHRMGGRRPSQSCTLVHLGGTKMACLQVWNPPHPDSEYPDEDFNGEQTHFDISFIEAGGSTSPKYLTSTQLVTKPGLDYSISDVNVGRIGM